MTGATAATPAADLPAAGDPLAPVFAALATHARTTPDRVALREAGGAGVTYRELAERVDALAAGLAAGGLRPGGHVYFMIRPSVASICLILAVLRVGGVLVAADPAVGDAVMAARLRLVPPQWLMVETVLLALTRWGAVRRLLRHRGLTLPDLRRFPAATWLVTAGPRWPGVPDRALDWRRLAATAAPGPVEPAGDAEAPAVVVFTSGTTARPKAVVHTRGSIAATMRLSADHLAILADDRVYSGEMHLVVPALLAGATAILPPGRFEPARFVADLRRHGATHAFLVPSDFDRAAAHLARRGATLPAGLRALLLGSAPVTRALLERCRPAVGPATTVWCVYAMTELLPVSAVSMAEKLAYTGDGDLVGAPFPGVRARIDGGELVVDGPNRCRGYVDEPPLTEVRTGDLARLDPTGRLVLLGRRKDMILRDGHNVYPALIEPTVERIAGVRACALVGVPDPATANERIVLLVEPLDGEHPDALAERVRRAMRSGPHSVDANAYPDAVVVAPLPRTGRSSKVDRPAAARLAARAIP